MARITAHGLSAETPNGWDGQIYMRQPLPAEALVQSEAATAGLEPAVGESTSPIVHLANFALPSDRADFGGGAVELMESGAVFIALIEHDPAVVDTPLFQHPVPWPLSPDDFTPEQMQRSLPGQAGLQRFFTTKGRAFCLYVVIGSYRTRALLTGIVNDALATVEIS